MRETEGERRKQNKRWGYNTQNPDRKKSCLSYTNMGKNDNSFQGCLENRNFKIHSRT